MQEHSYESRYESTRSKNNLFVRKKRVLEHLQLEMQEQQQKYVAMCRENERLMQELEMNRQLQRRQKECMTGMSHDIRLAMHAVLGFLQEMECEMQEQYRVMEQLDKLKGTSRYLMEMFESILLDEKMKSHHELKDSCPEPYRMQDCLHEVEVLLEHECKKKEITIIYEENQNEAILIDRVKFRRIWLNLLSNAIKYSPDGGKIWLTQNQKIEQDNRNVTVIYTLRDEGIGMSEEFLKHLFEPYAREVRLQQEIKQGAGLELSIVWKLVQQLNGKISVKSKTGVGTEFLLEFTMPLAREQREFLNAEKRECNLCKNQSVQLTGRKILLVEDHEIRTLLFSRILNGNGAEVQHAVNGKDAVEQFLNAKVHTFDAIVMDVRMPYMNGIQAAEIIRNSQRKDADILHLLLSADEEDIVRTDQKLHTMYAQMQGKMNHELFNGFLLKPCDPTLFCRVLEEMLMSSEETRKM